VARIFVDREEQLWHGFVETPAEEMRGANYVERRADAGAWTEAQRSIDMLDRDLGLASPKP
jgi:hypothetical protein